MNNNYNLKRILLEGRFAVVAIHEDHNRILAGRKGSPLVLGVGKNEYFIASDVPAFLDPICLLHDGGKEGEARGGPGGPAEGGVDIVGPGPLRPDLLGQGAQLGLGHGGHGGEHALGSRVLAQCRTGLWSHSPLCPHCRPDHWRDHLGDELLARTRGDWWIDPIAGLLRGYWPGQPTAPGEADPPCAYRVCHRGPGLYYS